MQNLVIVESPTKARTLAKFLGANYRIEASMGHVMDLPKSELGIDTFNNFEPRYIVPRDKKKKVNELKKIATSAENIWLASDPDREGEAIAWHIANLLKIDSGKSSGGKNKKNDQRSTNNKQQIKRVVFHEITESAIKEAFLHPRDLDYQLVDAQQARRVLDRLVGYKLSPVLWKKVKRGLSAGRVQTVALRLVVEREREIGAFKPIEHWSIEAELEGERAKGKGESFLANLVEVNGVRLDTKHEDEKVFFIHNKEQADTHVKNLETAIYSIEKITKREVRRFPSPPFTTSTLQQTAGNKLGYTAKRTMMLAQNLYEHGLITYMRTDSVNLSSQILNDSRSLISSKFGKDYLPAASRVFKSKSKNAQEAHEAIRPTNIKATAEQINFDGIGRDHKRLYDLIWKRLMASQMAEAVLDQTSVDVVARSSTDSYTLRASGSVLKFDGWLKIYGVAQLEEETEDPDEKKQILPELTEGENLDLLKLDPEQHFTEPPARFSESTLIKKLEELGIGRPSTYAPILSTIIDRYYVERIDRRFIPTALGMSVVDFLIKYFPDVFDYEFTASMEDKLDEISRGERQWKETIAEFYKPLEKKIASVEGTAEHVKLEVETTDRICPECGKLLVVRTGKFGKFLACAGFPECKHTEALEQITDVKCPDDGGEMVVRKTKKGKTFYGCKNYPNCKWAAWIKPKGENENAGK